jgi:molybdopterin converting factor small subunit
MKLHVKLFARARDLAGSGVVELELPDYATVSILRQSLISVYPELTPIASSLLIAVGTDYADNATLLSPSSDVACFPPVSGG